MISSLLARYNFAKFVLSGLASAPVIQKGASVAENYIVTYKDNLKREAQTQSDNLKLGYKNIFDANLTKSDAFRHIYASAKTTIDWGETLSEYMGTMLNGMKV